MAGLGLAAGADAITAMLGWQGEKPDVPVFKPVDVQAEQKKALRGNLAELPDAERLAAALNTFNQDQLQAMLSKAMPDYQERQKQISSVIGDMLAGKIPNATQVATRSAEKALKGGYSMSGAAGNLVLRDLAIDSLQYTQAGLDAANRWMQTSYNTGVPRLADASAMFVSPAQQVAAEQWNTEGAWNRQWLANRIEAMPSPQDVAFTKAARAPGEFIDSLVDKAVDTGFSVVGSYFGGKIGGGGGSVFGSAAGGGGSPSQPATSAAPSYNYNMYGGGSPGGTFYGV